MGVGGTAHREMGKKERKGLRNFKDTIHYMVKV